ncbi:hypothetical protein SAMN05216516_101370 [Izhakiella capsodis]|uniref:Uncharacterized protein n=1 Tax=Izhakiella capsodis TaxID=1367852 RepID=A0A1I4UVE5_9GAMM|nr:hypothetical protein SAMN05216516_101370 [Izhakiella capsodis]
MRVVMNREINAHARVYLPVIDAGLAPGNLLSNAVNIAATQ